MDLQHADLGEFGENLLPFLSREFATAAVEFDRVRTIGALQRTAMRQLGQHRVRRQDDPDPSRLVEFQFGVSRQYRPARLADTDVAAAARHRSPLAGLELALGTNAPGGICPST